MLEVDIEKIIPVTDARDSLNQIIETVEGSDSMYVITKNGKPSAIIVGVHHLEKLTGTKNDELEVEEETIEPAPAVAETSLAENDTTDTETVEAAEPKAATSEPFTVEPEADDMFAPLPEETSAAPAPAASIMPEPLVDLSKAPATPPAPTMPSAPVTPPSQASADQV